MPDRRIVLLLGIGMAVLVIAGLAVPGIIGGVLLLVAAVILAGLTTAVHTTGRTRLDSRNWVLRALVIMALAAIGLVKLFR